MSPYLLEIISEKRIPKQLFQYKRTVENARGKSMEGTKILLIRVFVVVILPGPEPSCS
jgi:hypothetical protein